MGKDAKVKSENAEQETAVATVVNNGNSAEISNALASGNLADVLAAKTKRSYTATAEYLKMEEGEVSRFAVMEVKTMLVDDENSTEKDAKKSVPCVLMVNEENKTVIAAQMKLVNALNSSAPCFAEVEYLGKVKLGQGRAYADYVVTILD